MNRTGKIRRILKKRRKHPPKGVSMIEFLIALGIMVIVFWAVLSVYAFSIKNFADTSGKADAMSDSQLMMNSIIRDVREAVRVLPGPALVKGAYFTTSPQCIVLEIPSIDSNGNLVDIENSFDVVVYRQNPNNSGRLERLIEAGTLSVRQDSAHLMLETVDALTLNYFDESGNPAASVSDTVLVDITIRSTYAGVGRNFHEYRNTQVKLRNKSIG